MRNKKFQVGLLVVLLALLAVVFLQRQAIRDWFRLAGYKPPAAVVQLVHDTAMTPKATHLFYVNKPAITRAADFTQNCPHRTEKTIVLGCYKNGDEGIYIYQVTDSRLQGVEQVTAAHEMLHAAYARLSSGERQRIDTMLENYYKTVTDKRIIDTISAYRQSEPDDVDNEMHSVFGTEIASLPAGLEAYYQQYFSDRSRVTSYAADYQREFTSRQQAVATYDSQLADLKQQIATNESSLAAQRATLNAQNNQLTQEQAQGDVQAYNAGVADYNAKVAQYNSLVQATKDLINQYNALVAKRNAVVLEEQQLTQAITASPEKVK
jgi:hypothetical protein